MRDPFWLPDEAWAALEPPLPENQPGARRADDRRVISGILHILKTASPSTIPPLSLSLPLQPNGLNEPPT